jgi:hypothetical protein
MIELSIHLVRGISNMHKISDTLRRDEVLSTVEEIEEFNPLESL